MLLYTAERANNGSGIFQDDGVFPLPRCLTSLSLYYQRLASSRERERDPFIFDPSVTAAAAAASRNKSQALFPPLPVAAAAMLLPIYYVVVAAFPPTNAPLFLFFREDISAFLPVGISLSVVFLILPSGLQRKVGTHFKNFPVSWIKVDFFTR